MNQKNLANGLILTSAGDVITLYPGYVDDMPAVPFFATGSKLGEIATLDNSEIVRVTAIDGDNLTCDRAQRGTVEQTLDDGWVLGNGIYTEDLAAIRAYVDTQVAAAIVSAKSQAKQEAYPIGSIYYNATDGTNPATLLGFGTWVNTLIGTAPVGKAASGTFATVGSVVGAETVAITQAQLPAGITGYFDHHGSENGSLLRGTSGVFAGTGYTGQYKAPPGSTGGASSVSNPGVKFDLGGSGAAHNNIQPSQVVNAWRRTA